MVSLTLRDLQMNYEIFTDAKSPVKAWIKGLPVDEKAMQQVKNLADLPFIFKHVALMPDYHYGCGATVGTVIATIDAIIPAAVGVDIGCGMTALHTGLVRSDLPKDLSRLREEIERLIPHGRTDNGGPMDRGAWHSVPENVAEAFRYMNIIDLKSLVRKFPELSKSVERAASQLGTLGTGNHFVEISVDERDDVWIVLHSGSRGVGNKIGTHFINLAKQEMAKWHIKLSDPDLAYLPRGTELFDDYLFAVGWAQNYALTNRWLMLQAAASAVCGSSRIVSADAIECHHNYVCWERHFGNNVLVTRKGAIRAGQGDIGIIPGSMGAKTFIVRGKGNLDSFCSSSHGAGRVMSRTEAQKTFTLEQHAEDTAGIECRKDMDVLDETPRAYKDIDQVMNAQQDLTGIVHTLRQVVCVKG